MPRARPSRYDVVLVGWCLCHFDFVLGVQSVSGTPREHAVGRAGEKLAEMPQLPRGHYPSRDQFVSWKFAERLQIFETKPSKASVRWETLTSSLVSQWRKLKCNGGPCRTGVMSASRSNVRYTFLFCLRCCISIKPGVHCLGWHVDARPQGDPLNAATAGTVAASTPPLCAARCPVPLLRCRCCNCLSGLLKRSIMLLLSPFAKKVRRHDPSSRRLHRVRGRYIIRP